MEMYQPRAVALDDPALPLLLTARVLVDTAIEEGWSLDRFRTSVQGVIDRSKEPQ